MSARAAVSAAAEAQRALAAHPWPEGARVRVRMGIHTGEPMIGEEGYLGIDVVRGARLCAAAHGGQVVLSETTRALVAAEEIEGVGLLDLGEHRLKGLKHPERIYQLVIAGLQTEFRPLNSLAPSAQPSVELEGQADELAAQAEEVVRDLRTSIEQDVVEQLKAAGVPGLGERFDPLALGRRDRPTASLRRLPRRPVVVGGAFLLVAAIVVVAIVYLVLL